MRKFYYYLLFTFIITGCDNKEELSSKSQSGKNPTQTYIINGDIIYEAEITDGSKPKKPILVYDIPEKTKDNANSKNKTYKTSEHTVSINFGYPPTHPSNSGCTVKRYNNGNSYYTDSGVYGINPYPYPTSEGKSCLVRGFGTPHHNLYYGSLILFVSNKEEKRTDIRSRVTSHNDNQGSAISIEYPFKANVSYEINLTVIFYDNRYLIDKKFSDGFPTVYAQLKDDGIITPPYLRNINLDPCVKDGVIGLDATDYVNNTRSFTLDSRGQIERYINFKFSPTKEKKALLISLHPKISDGLSAIPINDYTMALPIIKITEKPFDPSLNVEIKTSEGEGRGDIIRGR
ncbi:hypothetical protein [Flavobacterium ginsenosidimutans]|uniref:Lipoprotein n=1 Tax=Flavobacterium ginsenosidimutans TaxID=687844 RepID=A0ABZ2QCM1_9FLAO